MIQSIPKWLEAVKCSFRVYQVILLQGMYSEIKYDGERVQLHKQGSQYHFFSRSLKPVMPHKVADLTESVPKAFPTGQDMILDCEVLLVDNTTG